MAEHGADFIGFVFAPSKRIITPDKAKEIGEKVPGLQKVGVFVNAPLSEIREIAKRCRLDYIQLSGDESPEYCRQVGLPVMKTVKVPPNGVVPAMDEYPAEWLLLDTYIPGSYGGTGQTFDWRQAGAAIAKFTKPALVAGGLTPENVGDAVRQAGPQGVDVSGGVETNGQKDLEKIIRFIQSARAAERGEKP